METARFDQDRVESPVTTYTLQDDLEARDHRREIELKNMLPQQAASDILINHLLSQLESLYLSLFDEVSDVGKVLTD